MDLLSLLLAVQETAAPQGAPAAPAKGGLFGADVFVPLLAFMVIFYFLMWRPQAKERKARAAMIAAIKKGDRVMMTCGLIGHVAALTEQDVLLKFDDKDPRRMRFRRFAIQGLAQGEEAPAATTAASEGETDEVKK